MAVKKKREFVFVVMPFSEEFSDVYYTGIKPIVENVGLDCERVDEQHFTGAITDKIISNIKQCKYVIAEMSSKNPNVLYEVGYAHALGKPVILLARKAEDIPFDLKDKPHIFYSNIYSLKEILEKRLKGLLGQGC